MLYVFDCHQMIGRVFVQRLIAAFLSAFCLRRFDGDVAYGNGIKQADCNAMKYLCSYRAAIPE